MENTDGTKLPGHKSPSHLRLLKAQPHVKRRVFVALNRLFVSSTPRLNIA